jgi:hypothetical protein
MDTWALWLLVVFFGVLAVIALILIRQVSEKGK